MKELREAKELFFQKGQIKEKIVRKELAVSWRRCKMYGVLPGDRWLGGEIESDAVEESFCDYCERLVPPFISFFVSNRAGDVYYRRVVNPDLNHINSLVEKEIGTSSFSVSLHLKKDSVVTKEEHYLEALTTFTSRSILLPGNDLVITFFYEGLDNEYVYMSLKNSILSYVNEDGMRMKSEKKDVELSDYISFDEYNPDELENHLIVANSRMPLLIIGKDSDAVAWYLADRSMYSTIRVSHRGIPDDLLEEKLIEASRKCSALIIADIDTAPEKYLTLVAQIVDYMIENGEKKKKQIYITGKTFPDSERIIEKLQLSTVNLTPLEPPAEEFVFRTVEEMERELIEKTLIATDWNTTLASKKLGIGRATLYRKMKLYQFENKPRVSF